MAGGSLYEVFDKKKNNDTARIISPKKSPPEINNIFLMSNPEVDFSGKSGNVGVICGSTENSIELSSKLCNSCVL